MSSSPVRAWEESFAATAWQAYLAGVKSYWGGELYREVVAVAKTVPADEADDLELQMRNHAAYRLYGYLERRVQQLKWDGRYGFVTMVHEQQNRLGPILDSAPTGDAGITLDPSLTVPDYVTDTDTHQEKGGLWRDPLNSFALAWYTRGLSFSGTSPDALVDWYAKLLKEKCAATGMEPKTILDMGCTSGRSTRAIERVFPEADIVGLDVCEAPLRLGRLFAIEEKSKIRLIQQNAERLTSFADRSVDVVASHWLYHEMPMLAIRESMKEARRVLRSGGLFAAYDMVLVPGGLIGRWLQSGYAARNNEPFTHALPDIDFRGELEALGFTDVRLELNSPQHQSEEVPDGLPANRLHYMTLVTAWAP